MTFSFKYGTIHREIIPLPVINFDGEMFMYIAKDHANFANTKCPVKSIEPKNMTGGRLPTSLQQAPTELNWRSST